MKKWYDEEYEFTVEVTGFLHGDHTERYCRNGEEIGDRYTCTYGCPVNQDGYGICSKTMMMPCLCKALHKLTYAEWNQMLSFQQKHCNQAYFTSPFFT